MKKFVVVLSLAFLFFVSVSQFGYSQSIKTVEIPEIIWLKLAANSNLLSLESPVLKQSAMDIELHIQRLETSNENLVLINENLKMSLNDADILLMDFGQRLERSDKLVSGLKISLTNTQTSLDKATNSLRTEKSKSLWIGIGIGAGTTIFVGGIIALVVWSKTN